MMSSLTPINESDSQIETVATSDSQLRPVYRRITEIYGIGNDDDNEETDSLGSWQPVEELDADTSAEIGAKRGRSGRDAKVHTAAKPSDIDYNAYFRAIALGDGKVFERILCAGADLERETSRGYTALVIALLESHLDAVELLLFAGADVHHRVDGKPPLVHAALIRTSDRVSEPIQMLLNAGANLNSPAGPDGDSVLHWAASEGRSSAVEYLIAKGIDIEKKCRRGYTPLHVAAQWGHRKVAEVLIEHGANPGARIESGETPLMLACLKNHAEIVELLLDQPDSYLNAEDRDGSTALFYASEAGHVDCVDLLLKKGPDTTVLSRDPYEMSALMIAARRNYTQVLDALIRHGCSLNLVNPDGDTALDIAIKRGRVDATKTLLRAMSGDAYPVESAAFHFALAESWTEVRTLMSVVGLTYKYLRQDDTNAYAWLSMVLQEGGHLLRWRVMHLLLQVAMEDFDHALLNELLVNGFEPNVILHSGETPLGTAIIDRDLDSARILLENGADPKLPNRDGRTSLELALLGHVHVDMEDELDRTFVDLLLDSGKCRINQGRGPSRTAWSHALKIEDEETPSATRLARYMLNTARSLDTDLCESGSTLLHTAVLRDRADVIPLLLEHGVDINATDNMQVTPLVFAAQYAPHLVPVLLAHGADMNVKYRSGASTLHAAAAYGNIDVLRLLIELGMDLECETEEGYTPLACTITWAQEEAALFLMQQGAKIGWKTKDKGMTALHLATMYSVEPLVEKLLQEGLDVNDRDDEGWAPIHLARTSAILEMLLDAGADIEAALPGGNRALHLNLHNQREVSSLLLIERGADITAQGFSNNTPLHMATFFNMKEVVHVLLNKCATTECLDIGSRTPLFMCNDPSIAEMLITHGAEINRVEDKGWTPLHHVVCQGNVQVAKVLLEAGAKMDARSIQDGRNALDVAEDLQDEDERDMLVSILKETQAQRMSKGDGVEEAEYEIVVRTG